MEKKSGQIIDINEKFKPMGITAVDDRNRINLGKKLFKLMSKILYLGKLTNKRFEIFYAKNGDILLRPMVEIPAKEAWIYQNPEVIGRIRKGVTDIEQGRIHNVDDVDDFLEKL